MYILDTNVVSELRKANSGKANLGVVTWAASIPASSLYLSVVTVLELEKGLLLVARRDKTQGVLLRTWLDSHVLPAFHGRILAIDTAVAQRCAGLHIPDPQSERDSLIAATALVHGMTVVTRNVSDFKSSGALIHNPWS